MKEGYNRSQGECLQKTQTKTWTEPHAVISNMQGTEGTYNDAVKIKSERGKFYKRNSAGFSTNKLVREKGQDQERLERHNNQI